MTKAQVYQGHWWDSDLCQVVTGYEAWHECRPGEYWSERTIAWHNAFWAADHHVRHDCGRREQASSGSYTRHAVPEGYESDPCPLAYEESPHEPHIYKNWEEQKTWCPGPVAGLDPWKAHYQAELAAGEPICFCGTPWSRHRTDRYGGYTVTVGCMPPDFGDKTLLRKGVHNGPIEGEYRGDGHSRPTHTDMGLPLRGEYARTHEGVTVELGAISAEEGLYAGDMQGQVGDAPGRTGGHDRGTWWPWGSRA
jgi:hypothetical protein